MERHATVFNPLSPEDALKHHFASRKNNLISLKQMGFRTTIFMELSNNNDTFF